MGKINKLPPGAHAFTGKLPDRVGDIEEILYGNKELNKKGICEVIESHDRDIVFFKRLIKIIVWFVGISMGILITLFGFVLKLNIDLIQQVAILAARLTEHVGG